MEQKKELSMETRLLLAFLLMGLVLFGTQYFYKPPAQPAAAATKTPPAAATVPGDAKTIQKEAEAPAPSTAQPPAEMPGQIHADKCPGPGGLAGPDIACCCNGFP